MGGAEILSEFCSEFIPVEELGVSSVFFFPSKNPSSPFSGSSRFHVRQGPSDFDLVRVEGVRTETYISLDGGEESLSLGSFSIELHW